MLLYALNKETYFRSWKLTVLIYILWDKVSAGREVHKRNLRTHQKADLDRKIKREFLWFEKEYFNQNNTAMIDFYFSARGLPKIVKDNGHLEQKPALVIGDELYEYERINNC